MKKLKPFQTQQQKSEQIVRMVKTVRAAQPAWELSRANIKQHGLWTALRRASILAFARIMSRIGKLLEGALKKAQADYEKAVRESGDGYLFRTPSLLSYAVEIRLDPCARYGYADDDMTKPVRYVMPWLTADDFDDKKSRLAHLATWRAWAENAFIDAVEGQDLTYTISLWNMTGAIDKHNVADRDESRHLLGRWNSAGDAEFWGFVTGEPKASKCGPAAILLDKHVAESEGHDWTWGNPEFNAAGKFRLVADGKEREVCNL